MLPPRDAEGSPVTIHRTCRSCGFMASALIASLMILISSGCAATARSKSPLGQTAIPTAQNQEIDGWWKLLGSRRLDSLVSLALERNRSLQSAEAALVQARELANSLMLSSRSPLVGIGLSGQRQRLNPNMLGLAGEPREFTLYNVGLSASYQLDLSGGNRRSLEALAARTMYRQHELAAARLNVAAVVVTTALLRGRVASQLALNETLLDVQEELLDITRQSTLFGHGTPHELSLREAELANFRVSMPRLSQQVDAADHLLATLTGELPQEATAPEFVLEQFVPSVTFPTVVPSGLVRSRPDILAAEALLEASTAEYKVSVSRFFPRINLSASLGSQVLSRGSLFGVGTAVWSVLGQLTQPLLDPGLPSARRASLAAVDVARAHYEDVVLSAFREVADAMSALKHDDEVQVSLGQAVRASEAALASVEKQYELGSASYLQVLTSRLQVGQDRIALIDATAQRMLDGVRLFQALGFCSLPEEWPEYSAGVDQPTTPEPLSDCLSSRTG